MGPLQIFILTLVYAVKNVQTKINVESQVIRDPIFHEDNTLILKQSLNVPATQGLPVRDYLNLFVHRGL